MPPELADPSNFRTNVRTFQPRQFNGIRPLYMTGLQRHQTRTYDTPATSPTATAGSDVVQSGRPIFDDFFLHLWPYIGNNTANVVFQMDKRLGLIRIDQ
ncbi:hypothetical protein TNCV_1130721 [Trichonephila clavipes]|nr:hypothetical protein TNCV_1130721 [Trichonephila clavipes]